MLTTSAQVDTYLGSHSYDPGQVSQAVNAACAAIESYCDRVFDETEYHEWYNGTGMGTLILRQWPVTEIRRVVTSVKWAGDIANSSTDCVGATAVVHDGKLILTVVGGANAGTSTLTLSTYTTMALLAVAIAALGKGWLLTVSEEGKPQDLRPLSLGGLHLDGVNYLELPDDEYATAGVAVDYDSPLVQSIGGGDWNLGLNNIFVEYKAGFAAIPADLQFVATRLAADILQSTEFKAGVQSEKLGDYSYTLAQVSQSAKGRLAEAYTGELAPYRRLAL